MFCTPSHQPPTHNFYRNSTRLRLGMFASLRLRNKSHSHPNPPHLTLSLRGKLKNLKSFQAEHFRLESCYIWFHRCKKHRLINWRTQKIMNLYCGTNCSIGQKKLNSWIFNFLLCWKKRTNISHNFYIPSSQTWKSHFSSSPPLGPA